MSGTLFVVATPIGNLEDITLRALRVLKEADVIAAEDTRRTARLLTHFAITTPTLSFHTHNTRSRLPQLLQRLEAGELVALVSDAGTPGVSDPGVELVQECVQRGVRVEAVPGANAPMAAAVASGFPLQPLTVYGFPPTRSSDRKKLLAAFAGNRGTFTFFEAPHRIRRTLEELASSLGNRPIMVARELTKLHEELLRGTASDLIGQITEPRGELTVVVGPTVSDDVMPEAVSDSKLAADFGCLTDTEGLTRRGAISALARRHGISAREVYGALERAKESGE